MRIHIIFYYKVQGAHTHMRVFSGTEERGRGKAGDLCMTNEEFDGFREASEHNTLAARIEFEEER